MAPRAYWKGYLKLSLVSCPVALFPATSEREKISFHQLNKNTGNRIKYRKVDAETGDEVEASDIIKGYQVGKGEYLQLEPEELKRLPSRASAPSKSMSLFRARKLTNFIKIIRITSCLMGKSGSKRLR
jgi:Ku protein